MFITFEGGEGCGKSTQALALAEYLKSKGQDVVLTREPGGTKRGEMLREILLDKTAVLARYTELFLFSAARAEHVEQVLVPALKAGKWVICDRYVDSTTAYQVGGRGLPEDVVRFINMVSSKGVWPDLTVLLDIDVEAGLKRVAETRSTLTRFEKENLDFHRRVREKFQQLAEHEPQRIKVLNSASPIDKVTGEIKNIVGVYLK